jgi:hypothetical protein
MASNESTSSRTILMYFLKASTFLIDLINSGFFIAEIPEIS